MHGRAGDLFLACACLHDVPGALAVFDAEVLALHEAALRRIDPSPAFADEVAQLVRTRLFVGDAEHPPRIGEYAGRGSLLAWVRVIATRIALNLQRARTVGLAGGPDDLELATGGDAALLYAKANYREAFEAAVRVAVAELAPEQRTMLRLYYLDGLGIDKLAALYGMHRSTVARRLGDTRAALGGTIRAELRRTLGMSGAEAESIMSALYSQLTMSLGSLLRSE